jgi:hypothetical protein
MESGLQEKPTGEVPEHNHIGKALFVWLPDNRHLPQLFNYFPLASVIRAGILIFHLSKVLISNEVQPSQPFRMCLGCSFNWGETREGL